MSINETIIKIRNDLQKANLKKTGKNKFAGFEYFELADFLPKLNELMLENKINDRFYIKDGMATLELIQNDERQDYTIPFVLFDTPVTKDGKQSMQDIQYLGALNTYYKRYLYLNAFGITDGEVIDSLDNTDLTINLDQGKATQKQIEAIQKLNIDIDMMLKFYKISSINDLTRKQASEIISKRG